MSYEHIDKYIDEFCINYDKIEDYKIDYIKKYFYNYVKDIVDWKNSLQNINNLVIGTLHTNKYVYLKSKTNKNYYDVIYIRKENKYKKYNLSSHTFEDISNNINEPKLYREIDKKTNNYDTILNYSNNNLELESNDLEHDKNSLLKQCNCLDEKKTNKRNKRMEDDKNSYNKNKKMCCFIL